MKNLKLVFRHEKLFAFILFAIFVFSLLFFTGNITDGPRIVDDNQIFRLQDEFHEYGFVKTLTTEFNERIFSYKRFPPIYLLQKVLLAYLFKTNLVLWSLYTGLIVVLTLFFFFLFGRNFGFSIIESLLFAFLIMVGEQSIIWWRLLHGEGIGMLFLSLSFLFLIKSSDKYKAKKNTTYFIMFAILASLSKESFILILPALVLFRFWIAYRREGVFSKIIVKGNILPGITLLSVFFAELLFLKFYLHTTNFSYTGWEGFSISKFFSTCIQFFYAAHIWILIVFAFLYLFYYFFILKKGLIIGLSGNIINFLFLSVFALLIIIPQILLYQKSGFISTSDTLKHVNAERYLLPSLLGYIFFIIYLLNLINTLISNSVNHGSKKKVFVIRTVITLLFIFTFFINTKKVISNSIRYSNYNNELNKWFLCIKENAREREPIIIVYQNVHKLKFPLRYKYILNEYYNLVNIYFLPLPDPPDSFQSLVREIGVKIDKGATRYLNDIYRHSTFLKGLELISESNINIPVIAISNFRGNSKYLEKLLRNFKSTKINLANYNMYENSMGYICYIKK